ncbi:MAG: polyketide cyclase / dehydrase and lipid transport [Streptomycetaceae bacterium]|nr:MAG: polyketide cyclase / dehydrase and lipid transport [Streptomycetaceae bacterium]
MSDLSTATISVDAPLAAVTDLLFALDKYPEWSSSIKSVEVLGRDDLGRIIKAKMTIDAGMMKDRVILDYDWSKAPAVLSFSLDDADLLTAMDGSYEIKSIDADTTSVTYSLTVDLSMPIPAMMRQKAEKATIDQALDQLKRVLEA